MGGWWQVTERDLEELADTGRTFHGLALWHAGKAGEPLYPQEKGRNPKAAAAYLRAAGEVARSITLARVRVEELRAEAEKRAKAEALAEEGRRRVEEWKRAHPE